MNLGAGDHKPPMCEFLLMKFDTYEDYLDSLCNELDTCYLQDRATCRKIAEFGYRRDGQTYSRKEFLKKRLKVGEYLTPIHPNIMNSTGLKYADPAQVALALRERANRVGVLATIIFINVITNKGREISGYIDYAHSLLKKDWKPFFMEGTPIYPDKSDLGYFDWKVTKSIINNSLNFKTLMSPQKGLMFQHKYDRMLIVPDPFAVSSGHHSSRKRIKTDMYKIFVLIDHNLRTRK